MEDMMKVGDRVRWLGAKPGSWAGDGLGEIIDGESARRGFGGEGGKPGPAVNIRLDGPKGLTVWAGLDEVMPEL